MFPMWQEFTMREADALSRTWREFTMRQADALSRSDGVSPLPPKWNPDYCVRCALQTLWSGERVNRALKIRVKQGAP